jgi:hypothetical protein
MIEYVDHVHKADLPIINQEVCMSASNGRSTTGHDYDLDACQGIVEQFLLDWQNKPTYWAQEIDIQVELASRLQRYFDLCGRGTISARHSQHRSDKCPYSRVACEPYVILPSIPNFHPDIVVWGDDPENPEWTINENPWPILLVMEIKYKSRLRDCGTDDLRRLQLMSDYGSQCKWRVCLQLAYTTGGSSYTVGNENISGVTVIKKSAAPKPVD